MRVGHTPGQVQATSQQLVLPYVMQETAREAVAQVCQVDSHYS
jgi:hypothetical protein